MGFRRRFVGKSFDGLKRWRRMGPTCLGGNQYRLLYFFAGKQIVITHGFIKKTGPVPVSELDRAQRLMQEWHQHGA